MQLEPRGNIYAVSFVVIGIMMLLEKMLVNAVCTGPEVGRAEINCQQRFSRITRARMCVENLCPNTRPLQTAHLGGKKRSGNFNLETAVKRNVYEMPYSRMLGEEPSTFETLFAGSYSDEIPDAAVDLQDKPSRKASEEFLYALLPVEKALKQADPRSAYRKRERNMERNDDVWSF